MCQLTFSKKIKIPSTVNLSYYNNCVQIVINGKIRQLPIQPPIQFSFDNEFIYLSLKKNAKKHKKYFFLYISLIQTYLRGSLQAFKIYLILKGIGFKVVLNNETLLFKLGYSHEIKRSIPIGITVTALDQTKLILSGSNWDHLTQFASQLKQLKKIDPYKGKGILLKNETILRKEGKKSKK